MTKERLREERGKGRETFAFSMKKENLISARLVDKRWVHRHIPGAIFKRGAYRRRANIAPRGTVI